MPHIKGRYEYHGFISPAPHKDMTDKEKRELAKDYAILRETKYKGEDKKKKAIASAIAWSMYNKRHSK